MTKILSGKFLEVGFILLLAACSPAAPQPAPESSVTPPGTSSPTAPVVEGTEAMPTPSAQDEAVIEFHRSGGFAGISESWAIYADGRIVPSDGSVQHMSPDQVTALVEEISDAGFFDLADSYLPKNTCCDMFFYEITVRHEGQSKTVETMDGFEDIPEALQVTLQKLNFLLTSNES